MLNTAIARSSDLIVFWSDLSVQALGLPRPRVGAGRGDSAASSRIWASLWCREKAFHHVKNTKPLKTNKFTAH
jgi:hypothetical protein